MKRFSLTPMRVAALVATLALVGAACGQHPEVRIADAEITATGQVEGLPGDSGVPADEWDNDFDDPVDPADNGDVTDPDRPPSETRQPGDTGQPQPPGNGNGNGEQPAQPAQEPRGSDRTGAGEDRIVLGVHAPVTGAAPLPAVSFERSGDLFWQYVVDRDGDVLGRSTVDVVFRDDRYDPSAAVQVCRELAGSAFLLVGGGGTDGIQACGRWAERNSVPYFSNGVTERGLEGNDWYFAASMSYRAQGGLLAQYVARNFGDARAAMVVTDTENFDDAIEGWMSGVQRHNVNYATTLRHPRGDTGWYRSFAAELRDAGVEVIYILTAPVDYIRFAQQAHEIGYRPQFVGVGVTMGLNPVLGSGCPQVDGGVYFSPWPGLDWARSNAPDFFEAVQRYNGIADDISFGIWGLSKTQYELFKVYQQRFGNDLTREDFRDVTERARVSSGITPELSYSPDNHFGARTVHVLRANCDSGEHETVATFASGF